MCMWVFGGARINFDRITAFRTNQLLPEFSSNQFETLDRRYKHIEDVHETLAGKKIIFDKISAFWT